MKTVLVTGHLGLLGSACVRNLRGNFKISTTNFDLRDTKLIRQWFAYNHIDYVINCAAKVGGVKVNRDQPVDFLIDNLQIQSNIITACADYGIDKLVCIGTSCLFPKDAPVPVSEDSLLTGPFDSSVQAYAIAKLAGYALCKAHHDQYGRNYMTACPSNLYGPGDNYGESAHVIPALMSKLKFCMKTGEPLTVWGNGSAIREFLHVDDCADAVVTILENWNKPDLINIGSGEGVSIKRLVESLLEVTGAKNEVIWDDSQPTGIQNKTSDTSKLNGLGWYPKIGFLEGLHDTWMEFINNPNPRSK